MKKAPLNRKSIFAFCKRINHHIDEREKLDLNTVYNHLKEKYPVVLTNAYKLVDIQQIVYQLCLIYLRFREPLLLM